MAESHKQLLREASNAIDTYKRPDVKEAQQFLDELLQAANLGGVAYDEIESIEEYSTHWRVDTRWYMRGCENTSNYRIPSEILDAEDPIAYAKKWAYEQKVEKAKQDVIRANAELERAEVALAKLMNEAP